MRVDVDWRAGPGSHAAPRCMILADDAEDIEPNEVESQAGASSAVEALWHTWQRIEHALSFTRRWAPETLRTLTPATETAWCRKTCDATDRVRGLAHMCIERIILISGDAAEGHCYQTAHQRPAVASVLAGSGMCVALLCLYLIFSSMLPSSPATQGEKSFPLQTDGVGVGTANASFDLMQLSSIDEAEAHQGGGWAASPPATAGLAPLVPPLRASRGFVQLGPASPSGRGFERDGRPYRFVGMNFWGAMQLAHEGGRARIARELDRLHAAGIHNLRILACGEGPDDAPWRVLPTLQPKPRVYNEVLARELDFLLAQLSQRGMTAILVLNNQWSWSGGQAAYVSWFQPARGPIPMMSPAGRATADAFLRYTSNFYTDARAVLASHWLISYLTRRVNTLTHVSYAADPTIMAWELCNEPRAVGDATVREAYRLWLAQTAALIKTLAPKQLVTIGSEGMTPVSSYVGTDFAADHSNMHIDYCTVHIRPEQWSWYDATSASGANAKAELDQAIRMSEQYLSNHAQVARRLSKPLVLQELAMPRDGGLCTPAAPTAARDAFLGAMLRAVEKTPSLAGLAAWAWGGEGRAHTPGFGWRLGDAIIGDTPTELQGRYSIFDTDDSTLLLLKGWSAKLMPNQH